MSDEIKQVLATKNDIHEIISTIEKLIVHTCICRSSVEQMERRLGYLENRMKTALDQRKLNMWMLCASLAAVLSVFLVSIIKIIKMFL